MTRTSSGKITDDMIRDAARKAVTENTIGDYVFFWMYAPAGMNPAVYSALYNGSYLAVELVFSIIVMYALVKRGIIDMRL